MVAGGVVGVLGHQIGSGRGNRRSRRSPARAWAPTPQPGRKKHQEDDFLVGRASGWTPAQTRSFSYTDQPAVREGEARQVVDGGRRGRRRAVGFRVDPRPVGPARGHRHCTPAVSAAACRAARPGIAAPALTRGVRSAAGLAGAAGGCARTVPAAHPARSRCGVGGGWLWRAGHRCRRLRRRDGRRRQCRLCPRTVRLGWRRLRGR